MIRGNGLLATAFSQDFGADSSVLIFACGVSNSSETDPAAFYREMQLLETALCDTAPLVYFSSCALVNSPDADNAYLSHKRKMEAMVLEASSKNLVLRLPQVVGRTPNPNTLTNFLAKCIREGTHFSVWAKAERNLIDVDDIVAISRELIRSTPLKERVIAVASPYSLPMPKIIALFEQSMGRKAIHSLVDKGSPLQVDCAISLSVAGAAGVNFDNQYAAHVIEKYYGY
ncbi:NAD-dependent epimerase/dehydratase family protein [Solilutibacter silvestris]|uniref:NAD-dependent epimerase/dehydratase domain-containing protein n=1 Tax=Solilutibacter silvestris TaxID=1645665 RepID=A0A2K1Q2M9_9GAMM|nr:NAD-dependent epimerase/dehydratase family protein [Lysobacter silvestris]PNS09217.1 hypothetical protein Lysil_0846 [Lysobacter silvestris]